MNSQIDYKSAVKNIRSELKSYLIKGNLQSLVLGVSGGIDSTLCALLAKPVCDELEIPLFGRSLPASSNSEGENSRAKLVGKYFCTNFKEVNINPEYTSLYNLAIDNFTNDSEGIEDEKEAILKGNIKARIRMILLYDLAGASNGMVLSTDNYTEYLLGFWTLHGDVGDYGMIQNLWKTEVYEMAEWIRDNELKFLDEKNIVTKVIEADATDGLGISNTDLDQITPGWAGSSRDGYAEVDKNLRGFNMLLKDAVKTPNVIKAMKKLSDKPSIQRQLRTEFKRLNPVNIPRKNIENEN